MTAAARLTEPTLLVPVDNSLGEGPLWHPERDELFWVDINGRTLFACDWQGAAARRWAFDEAISAAAWIDRDRLLLAGETGLWRFDVEMADCTRAWPLEADDPATRPNDGRADRAGNFWIGTMGWKHETGAGAIYRVDGDGPRLYRPEITVPNSICFSPDGRVGYWTDTHRRTIWRQPLDAAGAPAGEAAPFVTPPEGCWPDGSVCDAEGFLWNAQWDGWRVVRYAPDGGEDRVIELPVQRATCPAFGGPDLTRLFLTTARTGLSEDDLARQPGAGGIWAIDVDVPGTREGRFRHLDGGAA